MTEHKPSEFERWAVDHFGGKNTSTAIKRFAERLVLETEQVAAPVQLAEVARSIGLEPMPIYRNIANDGLLDIVDGELRIVLNSTTGFHPPLGSPGFNRMKFSYAHELAHALFFDPRSATPSRIAPTDAPRREEELCNAAASRFLVPRYLLQDVVTNATAISPDLLREYANRFQVSLWAFCVACEPVFAQQLPADRFFMLSKRSKNRSQFGRVKPRCVICFMADSLKLSGRPLLAAYQGLDNIRPLNGGLWSLQMFFEEHLDSRQSRAPEWSSDEILLAPGKRAVRMIAKHRKVVGTAYVWTDGTVEAIEDTGT
jgi:hypothetical protein